MVAISQQIQNQTGCEIPAYRFVCIRDGQVSMWADDTARPGAVKVQSLSTGRDNNKTQFLYYRLFAPLRHFRLQA